MNTILVPVDFSKSSKNAYLFARQFAAILRTEVKVIHIYSGSFKTNEPLYFEPNKGREEVLQDRLMRFVSDIPAPAGDAAVQSAIDAAAYTGFSTVGKITQIAREEDAMLIVMGMKGAHDVVEKVLGSVSTGVAQKAHCPVILVPEKAPYRGFDHIVYASNYEAAGEDFLNQIVAFTRLFNSTLHFVHIDLGKQEQFAKAEQKIFDYLFKNGSPDFPFHISKIQAGNAVEGLNQYCKQYPVDLVVLANKHRSKLDNLLGKSTTKRVAMHAEIPLMIYHLD